MCSENDEHEGELTLPQQLIILFASLLVIEALAKLEAPYYLYLLPEMNGAEAA
tara:strand:- start:463 stop:621 length:159 start_codon:yes stop_codon:yes gene_type:complete